MERLIECERNHHSIYYTYEVDGYPVGGCAIAPNEDNYVHSVYIEDCFQCHGYATRMIQELVKLYVGKRLWLEAWKENIPAMKVYTKCGFKTFEEDFIHFYNKTKVSMEVAA